MSQTYRRWDVMYPRSYFWYSKNLSQSWQQTCQKILNFVQVNMMDYWELLFVYTMSVYYGVQLILQMLITVTKNPKLLIKVKQPLQCPKILFETSCGTHKYIILQVKLQKRNDSNNFTFDSAAWSDLQLVGLVPGYSKLYRLLPFLSERELSLNTLFLYVNKTHLVSGC